VADGVKKRAVARGGEEQVAPYQMVGHQGGMLKVDCAKWGHGPEDLRLFAQEAAHARTRERFLALYEITQGRTATHVAAATGRHDETVHQWVHRYNQDGPLALLYARTGGRPPFALNSPKRSVSRCCKPSSTWGSPG
jgi:Homeodomain-like domain